MPYSGGGCQFVHLLPTVESADSVGLATSAAKLGNRAMVEGGTDYSAALLVVGSRTNLVPMSQQLWDLVFGELLPLFQL